MTNEPRYVYGIAYDRLTNGNQAEEIQTVSVDELDKYSIKTNYDKGSQKYQDFQEFRQRFYNDPAVVLASKDILNTDFNGKPVYPKHNTKKRVGTVITAWQNSEDPSKLQALAKIEDKETIAKIDNGTYKGFSVGYTWKHQNNNPLAIKSKHIKEISVVENPFFGSCFFEVKASEDIEEEEDDQEVER